MPHILFVCTANICRSPVAEAVLRRRLRERGMADWTVGSAGTWAVQERGAAQNSVHVLAERGIDISDHRSRMVSREMLDEADLILCMESGHVEALKAEFPEVAHRIHLLSEMVGEGFGISDPYRGPLEEYQQMAVAVTDLIDRGLQRIVDLAWAHHKRRSPRDTGE